MTYNFKKCLVFGALGVLCIFICGTLFVGPAYGQDNKTVKTPATDSSANKSYFDSFYNQGGHAKPTETAQVPQTDNTDAEGYWVQDRLCIMLLSFAVLLCAGEIYLFLKGKMDQHTITKLIILTLVIFALLFLITAGYSNSQTQTAVGLLGTIAGYMLGRTVSDTGGSQQNQGQAPAPAVAEKSPDK